MDSFLDLTGSADLGTILLSFMVLTLPCGAFAIFLLGIGKRRNSIGDTGGGKLRKAKAKAGRLVHHLRLLVVASMLGLALLGLIPLTQAVIGGVSAGISPDAPLVVGGTLTTALFLKGVSVWLDLRDGKLDRPIVVWAMIPTLAAIVWLLPSMVDAAGQKAGESLQMIFVRRGG